MELIKSIILKLINNNQKKKLVNVYKIYRTNTKFAYRFKNCFKNLLTSKAVKEYEFQGQQFKEVYKKVKVNIDCNELFVYSVNFNIFPSMNCPNSFGNLTVDYNEIIPYSIEQLKNKYSRKNKYDKNITFLLEGIELLVDKTINSIEQSNIKNKEQLIKTFQKIKNGEIDTTFEAMQKILFYNQLLWQSDVTLVGLGRLDKILEPYYEKDKTTKSFDNEMKKYIKSFYRILHKDFYMKSGALVGDTGQIIILGGKEPDGTYFCNNLTYLFIETLKDISLPDPKILLRVSSNMPDDLLKLAIDTICTGIGSPLLANDDVIIKYLLKFGLKNDSYNYVTSACWEPYIASKASDLNNLMSINYLIPFNKMLDEYKLDKFKKTEDILIVYKKYLQEYMIDFLKKIDTFKFNNSGLLSLFFPNCYETQKDIGANGALYNNYGVTSVGISSVVNSIINIDTYVF